MSSNITVRIEPNLKAQAEELFQELGMSMSTAFTVFLKQAVRLQAIPFSITRGTFNQSTLAAMREAEAIANDTSVPAFHNREALLHSLES